jgi:hypothetical protein
MPDLVAELGSPVWQNKNRTSFKPFAKAYFPDMMMTADGAQRLTAWMML